MVCIVFNLNSKNMDKRSFSLLFAVVAASMVILGTYKMTRKKSQISNTHTTLAVIKNSK